jgi:ABC-2 type transport system ATP-binding protein
MIHVENLTKNYGGLCAVDGIDLDVRQGEILGLLGPNGAGKTTTLRMLTGFLKPTAGNIQVKDFNIDENCLEVKKRMGYLPELAPLYRDMLVYDYLQYVACIRDLRGDEKLDRIRKLAHLCGLNQVMHKPIGELSRGYRQRVGLAHAMMNDPEVLVLDEPTTGLDPNQIVEIREIIKQIGKEKTIIFSTHILSEAEATCDRIVIINRGRIVADGSKETLKQSMSGQSQINLSLQGPNLESVKQKLAAIDGVSSVSQTGQEGDILHVRISCGPAAELRGRIYHRIKETDWTLLELHQEGKTLENIFRELTKEN